MYNRFLLRWFITALPLCLAAVLLTAVCQAQAPKAAETITPAEWLQRQPKPKFHEGATLPPLTRFGWVLPFAARVELAEHWGYALEFGGYATAEVVDRALTDAKSDEAQCVTLAAKDPARYKLAVICSRELPAAVPPETWTRNADGKFLDGQAHALEGTIRHPEMPTVYSPESPDVVWQQAGALRADPLRRLRAKCPIAMVLNGGEYGLNVLGFAQKVWEQDPLILKAKGEQPWFDYISARKAHEETLIADAVRAAVPDRTHYIYYTAGGGTEP